MLVVAILERNTTERWKPFLSCVVLRRAITEENMFAVQFIFQPGTYDEEFYALDDSIEEYVAKIPGFLGVEKWLKPESTIKNSIYYFETKEAVLDLARFGDHREAKGRVRQWYDGYQVIITEVIAAYGDGNIPSIAAGVKGKSSFYAG